jgi:precorrin-6Y C5,15-methyltransferase (decarboxylating)
MFGMADAPWLTIIGIGEDGVAGLCEAGRAALAQADCVTGATRHLALLPGLKGEVVAWPVPFRDGLPWLAAQRGRRVAMLVSGDPFWFGAGSVVARMLAPGEWLALPGRSVFALAAARLGWAIEDVACLGLHAAPLTRLRPLLAPGLRALVLLRDGAAVAELAALLAAAGFGASVLHVLEALGGPRERIRRATAETLAFDDIAHPVAVGIDCAGAGDVLPGASGRPDHWFEHDGQISKRPVRALALSALAPRAGETLWDIGTGSGSIAIEWLLAHPANRATAFEADPLRAARARGNGERLGVDRLTVVEGRAPDILAGRAWPDAAFVGGGLSDDLLAMLCDGPARIVAHAVTLESEALLTRWHRDKGGSLLRIELSDAVAIGSRRGWRARYPLVQWSLPQ